MSADSISWCFDRLRLIQQAGNKFMLNPKHQDAENIRGSWKIPCFVTKFWQGRTSQYCVVVPVINEGDRIKSLLSKMFKKNIFSIADTIIIDGGSTDGSLKSDDLKNLQVRGLLVMTDVGRLSSQLRCAYSFALDRGYKGIITIDGNDKDDPEAITRFISALERGGDFIQGSRFVEGGVAENTPLTRYLAIRFLHSPLLGLCSGFRWTDTTQGFRAYSRKMLLDPQVSPFRDVFKSYELLAYLSYRVPKLNYVCLEIPTARRYPRGKLPTKISGVRGNISLFLVLLNACLGKYNPDIPR